MTEGPFSLKCAHPSPSTIAGASLLDGDEVLDEVTSNDEKECILMLFKGLCGEGTKGLKNRASR